MTGSSYVIAANADALKNFRGLCGAEDQPNRMSSDLELSSDSVEQTSTDEEEFENEKDEYSMKTNRLEDSLRSKRFRASSSRKLGLEQISIFFWPSLQLSRNYSIGNACYPGLL